ncbi:uncharacterized protein [Ranitomeya imitator]|uniref:uncharacterized protein n=1 Tax=Ranitomeya imitator TaxID=111125 RepID=UPI0037E6FC2D
MFVSELVRFRLMRLRLRQRKRSSQRRYWIHEVNFLRSTYGAFHTLYVQLRDHPFKFQRYLRMSIETFDVLLSHVKDEIHHHRSTFRESISAEQRLVVTVRYLATGETFASLHYQFRLGKSTICQLVRETCDAIWNNLQPLVLPTPTSEMWLAISQQFEDVANFPNCIGTVDGKHIRIQKPAHSGSLYYNYKKYFSIVWMAIADARYRFVAVDIGAYGRTNDSRVFRDSNMGRCLYSQRLNIPSSRPLPGTEGPSLPYVLVGDEAFQLGQNLLKPYSSRSLDSSRRIFNYRLSRARRYVECAFGILTLKWRILLTCMQLQPENVDRVVKACICLHNFVARHEPQVVDPDDCELNLSSIESNAVRSTAQIMRIRDQFAHYFTHEGHVPWQDRYV